MIDFSPFLDVHTAYELLARPDRLGRCTPESGPSAMATLLDLDLHLYEWFDTNAFGDRIRGTDQARIEARVAGTQPDPFLGGGGLVCSLFCADGLKAAASKSMRQRTPKPDRELWLIAQALARPLLVIDAIPQDSSALFARITTAVERKQIGIAAGARAVAPIAGSSKGARRRL